MFKKILYYFLIGIVAIGSLMLGIIAFFAFGLVDGIINAMDRCLK